MSSDWEAIRRVVEAFDRADWSEIDVRWRDVRVHLVARAADGVAPAVPAALAPVVGTTAPPPEPSPGAAGPSAGDLPVAAFDQDSPGSPGAHVVVAPSPGIFWRAPEPGAPPFVEVGDQVDDSTTLCIIEVMKLMSHLKAEVVGTVTAIYGTDGVPVAKGQPLVAIAPHASAP